MATTPLAPRATAPARAQATPAIPPGGAASPPPPSPSAATAAPPAAPAQPQAATEDALQGYRLLKDPKVTRLPGFLAPLAGIRYKDVDDLKLPIDGECKPGADTKVWVPHVRQGKLGDCWYMGTQAAIALADPKRFPLEVRRIDDEHVAVRYGGGEIALSDDLPVRRNGQLAFARTNGPRFNATWPVFYEKAAAAERGSYTRLDGGWPHEAFEMILGKAPTRIDKPGDLFQYIHDARKAGLPVAVTTRPSQTEAMEQARVYSNHTYAVREVVVREGNGKAADLVAIKLWNPWGRKHPRLVTYEQFQRMFDSVTTSEEYFTWNGVRSVPPA